MRDLTDSEFIDGIFERLSQKGWKGGKLGFPEGPNCLLGAAGYVGHESFVVDSDGINPLGYDGVIEKVPLQYEAVPALMRLTHILGLEDPWIVVNINDQSESLEEVKEKVEERLAEVNYAAAN